jgi:hypothetical protein
MSGADIRYFEGAHPLTGRWAPDLVLDRGDGPVRLAELTRTARPLLFDFSPDSSFAAELADTGAALAPSSAGGPGQVEIVAASTETPGAPIALLLRPDGYVAWAADGVGAEERDGLRAALSQWFGLPDQRPLTSATR